MSIRLDIIKQINLQENIKPIGKVLHARFADSLNFYILDSQGNRIILYDTNGMQRKIISRYGDGPAELKDVLSLAAYGKEIFIPEYYRGIKVFTADGAVSKNLLVKDNSFVLTSGDIEVICDSLLFLTCVWDGKIKGSELAAAFIDTSGNIKQMVKGYPEEYDKFLLDGRKCGAIREDGVFAICFSQSPALVTGEFKEKKYKLLPCSDQRALYISPNRRSESGSSTSEMWKLLKEEWLNYRIIFLNDTLLARARCRETEQSIRLKSLVLRQNAVDIFTLDGDRVSEVLLSGRLHDATHNLLLIEESDEPERRQFSICKVNLVAQD